MSDQKPYYNKYNITRKDGQPVGRTFTIEIDRDPQAKQILEALAVIYRDTRPQLAENLLVLAEGCEQANLDNCTAITMTLNLTMEQLMWVEETLQNEWNSLSMSQQERSLERRIERCVKEGGQEDTIRVCHEWMPERDSGARIAAEVVPMFSGRMTQTCESGHHNWIRVPGTDQMHRCTRCGEVSGK